MANKTWSVSGGGRFSSLLKVEAESTLLESGELPIRLIEDIPGEEIPTTYYFSEEEALALADRLKTAVAWLRKEKGHG